jgi:hypothetical protein
MPHHQSTLVACARWETDCIVEWITYHRRLGFSHLHLYCNDDSPDPLYAAILPFIESPDPFVTFHFYEAQGQQKHIYLHYLQHHKHETEWFMFLDIDEFLRLPKHQTLPACLADLGANADGIYLNWSSFGHNFHATRPLGSVLLNYTRRAATILNGSCKILTRAAAIDLANLTLGPRSDFWHYWDSLTNFRALNFINALGDPVHDYNENHENWAAYLTRPDICARLHATAIINHYAYKAGSDFHRRAARGTKGDFANQAAQPRFAATGEGAAMLATMNAVEDLYLHDLWANVLAGGRSTGILAPPGLKNVSRGKPATQSSVYQDGQNLDRANASAATNGSIDGTRKFHTALEPNPWWQVDLGTPQTIQQIRVYNTTDPTAPRCRNLALTASIDGQSFATLAEKTDNQPVGNLHTTPYTWTGHAWCRYLRVTLLGEGYLHLDQVEVFGK